MKKKVKNFQKRRVCENWGKKIKNITKEIWKDVSTISECKGVATYRFINAGVRLGWRIRLNEYYEVSEGFTDDRRLLSTFSRGKEAQCKRRGKIGDFREKEIFKVISVKYV